MSLIDDSSNWRKQFGGAATKFLQKLKRVPDESRIKLAHVVEELNIRVEA